MEWDAVIGASRYTLTRSTDQNDANPAVIYNGGDRSHIDDMNVEFDAEYYYRVQACNFFGCAAVSDAEIVLVPTPTDNPSDDSLALRADLWRRLQWAISIGFRLAGLSRMMMGILSEFFRLGRR